MLSINKKVHSAASGHPGRSGQESRQGSGQGPGRGRRISPDTRTAIRDSEGSARAIARRYGLNLKTVLRWRNRASAEARKPGPRRAASIPQTEVLALGLRRYLRLSLDDCLDVLRTAGRPLSRASLHRCFRRHGISRLPGLPDVRQASAEPGWFDLHRFAFGQAGSGRTLHLAVERQSRFVFAEFGEDSAGSLADFLHALRRRSPVTVLGVCTERPSKSGLHPDVVRICADAAIRCRTLDAGWPDEKRYALEESFSTEMNGLFTCGTAADQRRLASFLDRYNHRSRLKMLAGLTPAAFIERKRQDAAAANGIGASAENEPAPQVRERILECARALLASAGPEGMSLSRIARLARVNRGTIYHYFKSRDELVSAAAEWSSEQLAIAVFGQDAGGRPAATGSEGALRVLNRLANFAIRNPAMCRAWLFQMLSMHDPSKDRFWREYYGRSLRFHETPFAIKDVDTEVLALTQLASVFLWPTWVRARSGGEANQQRHADRYIREYLRLIIHGALPEAYLAEADAELRAMRERS